MMRLFNYPLSPCGEKVRYVLLEKRLAFEEVVVDLAAKANLESAFLALNPSGLVPVLQDGTRLIRESSVINEYLEDAYPDPPLRPADPVDRATMRLWTKEVDEILHPVWPSIAWPVLIRPRWLEKSPAEIEAMLTAMPDSAKRERQRAMLESREEPPEYKAALAVFAARLDRVEAALGQNDWLAGETLSLADLSMLPYLFVGELVGFSDWMLGGRPGCTDWYRRLARRPAFADGLHSLYPSVELERIRSAALRRS